jgi:hypothetical protein
VSRGGALVTNSSSLRKREEHKLEERGESSEVEGLEGGRGLGEDELWAAHHWCPRERQIDLLLGRVSVLERHWQVVRASRIPPSHTHTQTQTRRHRHTQPFPSHPSPLIATRMRSRTEARKQCTEDDELCGRRSATKLCEADCCFPLALHPEFPNDYLAMPSSLSPTCHAWTPQHPPDPAARPCDSLRSSGRHACAHAVRAFPTK